METDTFANNRLSLTLHSENPVRHLVKFRAEVYPKGAAMLYETLKDPKTAFSEDPDHSPVMYANNKAGITGTFFDWIKQQVRSCSIHEQSIYFILLFRTLKERRVERFFDTSKTQRCTEFPPRYERPQQYHWLSRSPNPYVLSAQLAVYISPPGQSSLSRNIPLSSTSVEVSVLSHFHSRKHTNTST